MKGTDALKPKPSKAFERLVDAALAYHPKPKSAKAKKRRRKAKRIAKNG